MDLTERGASANRHPWELQRFEAYRRVLADHGALNARRVLDVGSGDGWFTDSLANFLPSGAFTVCWDVNYDDNDLEPSRPGIVRTRDRPDPGYDLVLALDVLEHLSEPVLFIAESLAPLTTPGARALIAVPAYQRLFSSHDEALGHFRRYGRRELLELLDSWIEVVEHGSLFTSLLAPRAVTVLAERIARRKPAEHGVGGWAGGTVMTAAVNGVLAADARAARAAGRVGVRLPGLSHWAFGITR